MKLGVISDTHDHIEHIARAIAMLHARGVETIIHLGDYCAGPAVRAFAGAHVIGILGNNDGDPLRIANNFAQIGGDFRADFCVLAFDGLKIACYHGTVPEITEALIDCRKYDVVLFGHTHEARQEMRGGIIIFNPGSAHGFGNVGTVGILDTTSKTTEILEIV